MVTAVEVAEDISSLLARYEIDEAAELVEGAAGTTLPPALCEALRQLLHNLRAYSGSDNYLTKNLRDFW